MADIGKHPEPGEPGSETKSGIKTPMCSANVGQKNTPTTMTFDDVTGSADSSGKASIMGPGAKGDWSGPAVEKGAVKSGFSGTNNKRRY